jgi:hypothetical protein
MAETEEPNLFHDPVWLGGTDELGDHPSHPSEFYLCYDDGRLIGYAPLIGGVKDLRFVVGELALHRVSWRSLTLVQDLVIAGGPELRLGLTRQLLDLLAERLCPTDGIFLEGVPTDSALYRLTALPGAMRDLLAIEIGHVFPHHRLKLAPSFAEFEAQLSASSRQSQRRQLRKLLEYLGGDFDIRCFTGDSEVGQFVVDARRVSQKSYQWRLLGLGLRDPDSLSKTLTRAARHGWLRCYILYCRGEPAAFMLGYLYHGTYHYIDVGYDPAWGQWGVGSILQLQVIRDLIEGPEPAALFDFSTGHGEHKARLANISRSEANLLLVRNCARNAAIAAGYRLAMAVDRQGGRLLDTLGIKARVKHWLRRAA